MVVKARLLPVTIVACALVLGVKLGDLWQAAEPMLAAFAVAPAQAQSSLDEAGGGANEEAESAPGETQGGGDVDLRQRLRKKIEAIVEQELEEVEALRRVRRQDCEATFTEAEVEVLQSLSERREALQNRAGEFELRENLLSATEKRIEEKIAELKKLEATIQAQLKQYDEQEEAKMKSLVKIYENMKPKDAARILKELDMEVLLEVAERMREAKMASILAQMDSEKAKAITIELANRRQLPALGG
jgi:flagellar motility protein MotE (MotC chaperone)